MPARACVFGWRKTGSVVVTQVEVEVEVQVEAAFPRSLLYLQRCRVDC